jgi:protease-4
MSGLKGVLQAFVIVIGTVVALVAGYLGFVVVPEMADVSVWGVVFVVSLGFAGLFVSQRIASSFVSPYNTAEVAVSGPISREGPTGLVPSRGFPAERIVDAVERADDDSGVDALVVRLNTPGGEVVPSDDIRRAVEEFDGPALAYATDTCASGGYWIASACDEIHARETSLVGSIGVLGSRVNAKEAADKLGIEYERLVAGRYKDAGTPLKETDEEEREYLQGIIDGFYDEFVGRVAEGREMDEDEIRETEARVYLGKEAKDEGLVDYVGTREDMEDRLEEIIDKEPEIREFTPSRSFREQIGSSAGALAYSFGAGVASVLDEKEFEGVEGFDFRLR